MIFVPPTDRSLSGLAFEMMTPKLWMLVVDKAWNALLKSCLSVNIGFASNHSTQFLQSGEERRLRYGERSSYDRNEHCRCDSKNSKPLFYAWVRYARTWYLSNRVNIVFVDLHRKNALFREKFFKNKAPFRPLKKPKFQGHEKEELSRS